ncbi:MAG: sugar phosphate isomerase/epimerase [Oscillospiraceae bacterium]|nr:sugar phosphate isomerase/epimerase [Oscillospiraceae bacterium]
MLALSSSCCPREQLIPMLQRLQDNGLHDIGIEIFYDALPLYDNANIAELLRPQIERQLVSFHYPMDGVRLMCDDVDGWAYKYSITRLRECLRTAQLCNAEYMVIHAALYGEKTPQAERESVRLRWRERYVQWAALAAEYGVKLLVENCGSLQSDSVLFNQEQFAELFAEIPGMECLVDIGHAQNCGWDMLALIEQLGDKIKAYHLHNNDGTEDKHWPLRDKRGAIDYDPILRKADKNALMIVEYGRWTFDDLEYIIEELKWLRSEYGY